MDIARENKLSSDVVEAKTDLEKFQSDDDIVFNGIRPGTKVCCLRARLTFKLLQEDGLGVSLLITSWIDVSGVEFQGKAWNQDALRINAQLEVEVVYGLRDVWVFYVMYDDSRITNVKYLNFRSDSQVLHVEDDSIPHLHYDYMCNRLTNAIVSDVPRFTIDLIGVFQGWEDTFMKLITPRQTVILNVEKVLNQIGNLALLQPCQVIISLKGVRVEVVNGDLTYRCFLDSILLIGQCCPNSVIRNNLEAWIEEMNAEWAEAFYEYSRYHRCQG